MNITCSNLPCPRTYPSAKWGKTRAARKGWFFDNDMAWCPEHNPSWAPPWRDRKKT